MRKKIVYPLVVLSAWGVLLLLVWLSSGVAQALGYSSGAQVAIGLGLGASVALWTTAVLMAMGRARDEVAEIVAHELARRDSGTEVTALADAVKEGRHRLRDDVAWPPADDDETPALLTHDELYGAYAAHVMPDTDVAEASPRMLFRQRRAGGE